MPAAIQLAATSEAPHFSITRLFRSIFIEGGRFWERGRLAYNGIQLFLTAIMLIVRWRDAHFFADNLGAYMAFAIIANVLYTAAYLPEAILQIPRLRPFTTPARWCIFMVGTGFACLLAVGALDAFVLTDSAND